MKKYIKIGIWLVLGCMIAGLGTSFFLLPNQLSSGGFAGIATLIYYYLAIPMGTSIIILNIPLFIISYFKLGKKFILKTTLATILYSVFIDLFSSLNFSIGDRFLSSIYGGISIGLGLGLVFKAQASTGGTDLIVNIIKIYTNKFKTSNILIIMDGIIVILNLIFFKEIEIGLYSVISIIIIGKMIDIVFEGVNFCKIIYIISDKYEIISKQIIQEIDTGVTGLFGKGIYSKKDKTVLMCVTNRKNIIEIKNKALEIDKNAFIIITDAREVFGLRF